MKVLEYKGCKTAMYDVPTAIYRCIDGIKRDDVGLEMFAN